MGKTLYNSMLIHGYAVSSIATNLGESKQVTLIRKEQSVIAIPDIAALIRATIPSPRHAPVAQHEACPARLADPVAEIVRGRPCVRTDAYLIEGARAAAAHERREQARILVADHGAEPLHGAGIHRERLVAAEAGRELHAPHFGGAQRDALFEPRHERIRGLLQQRHQLATARRRYPLRRPAALLRTGPIFDGGARDGENVAARLLRHRTAAGEPLLNPARAGIVGGGRQSQIAELVAQFGQKLRRFG